MCFSRGCSRDGGRYLARTTVQDHELRDRRVREAAHIGDPETVVNQEGPDPPDFEKLDPAPAALEQRERNQFGGWDDFKGLPPFEVLEGDIHRQGNLDVNSRQQRVLEKVVELVKFGRSRSFSNESISFLLKHIYGRENSVAAALLDGWKETAADIGAPTSNDQVRDILHVGDRTSLFEICTDI